MTTNEEPKITQAEEKPVVAGTAPVAEPTAPKAEKPAEKPKEIVPKERIFVYDGREFQDPDPKMTPDEIRQYYVAFFTELANAEILPPVARTGKSVIEFKRRVGTKGSFVMKFLDGSPVPESYLEALQPWLEAACDAEDRYGVDECERFSREHRA